MRYPKCFNLLISDLEESAKAGDLNIDKQVDTRYTQIADWTLFNNNKKGKGSLGYLHIHELATYFPIISLDFSIFLRKISA